MPVKKGGIIDVAIINPLIGGTDEAGYKRVIERYASFLLGDRRISGLSVRTGSSF